MKPVTDLQTAKYELDVALLHLQQAAEAVGAGLRLDARMTAGAEPSCAEPTLGKIEFSIEYGKLIVGCWGTGFATNWRVTGYHLFPNRMVLAVERQAGKITGQVTVSCERQAPLPATTTERRQEFSRRLAALLKSFLPGAKIVRTATHQGKNQHYARVVLIHNGAYSLAIGVNAEESQETVDGLLSAGLEAFSEIPPNRLPTVERVLLVAPAGGTRRLAERLTLVTCGDRIALYETDVACRQVIRRVEPGEQPALVTGPASRYLWPKPDAVLTANEQQIMARVMAFSPGRIDVHAPPQCRYLSLRWMGLEFARVTRETSLKPPGLSFGLTALAEPLRPCSEKTWPELLALLNELARHRTAQATDATHPLYRAQSERWLEAVVRREIEHLDPLLDPAYAYSQAPAYSLDERGYVDLLGVTRAGQLAVLELKAEADRELPWQGLDYWRRVAAHARRGDFARRGYFPGVKLHPEAPPLLYLIAPMLQVHKTLKKMCAWVDPGVPLQIVGLSQHWRRELRVIWRDRR